MANCAEALKLIYHRIAGVCRPNRRSRFKTVADIGHNFACVDIVTLAQPAFQSVRSESACRFSHGCCKVIDGYVGGSQSTLT